MASCIWSTPLGRMLDYPAQTFVRFFDNHGLLTRRRAARLAHGARRQPLLCRAHRGARCASGRGSPRRPPPSAAARRRRMVRDAGRPVGPLRQGGARLPCRPGAGAAGRRRRRERDLLGRFAYSSNEVWLHADPTLMPRRRAVWSSWNYVGRSEDRDSPASVTYWMNRLQDLPDSKPLFVSLNPGRAPAGRRCRRFSLRASDVRRRRDPRPARPACHPGHARHLVLRQLLRLRLP